MIGGYHTTIEYRLHTQEDSSSPFISTSTIPRGSSLHQEKSHTERQLWEIETVSLSDHPLMAVTASFSAAVYVRGLESNHFLSSKPLFARVFPARKSLTVVGMAPKKKVLLLLPFLFVISMSTLCFMFGCRENSGKRDRKITS